MNSIVHWKFSRKIKQDFLKHVVQEGNKNTKVLGVEKVFKSRPTLKIYILRKTISTLFNNIAHCIKVVLQTNLPKVGMIYIF